MEKNVLETLIGAVVLVVAGAFLMFAYEGSQMRAPDGYVVSGKFDNVSGISLGSDVRIGGIKVGVVSDMSLDPQTYEAIVAMQIRKDTKLPDDSSASIVSSGLLGDKYIKLIPGGSDKNLADNGKIQFTQSSVNLEEMIGKFMFSGGGVEGKSEKDGKKAASPARP